jgi:ribosome maturation factor RimP
MFWKLLLVASSCLFPTEAWMTGRYFSVPSSATRLHATALPDGYQELGDSLIQKAAMDECMLSQDNVSIEWKPGRIVVTVRGTDVYVSNDEADDEFGDDDVENEFEDDDEFEDENIPESSFSEDSNTQNGIDVTKLARAINAAMDSDEVGLLIAETHEIEVTTPGASNVIQGDVMFEAYRGFEVFCEFQDPKTKKIKKIEGRLVERNDEFTVINIKGRQKKIKNDMVLSVALPKAKKEKGVA